MYRQTEMKSFEEDIYRLPKQNMVYVKRQRLRTIEWPSWRKLAFVLSSKDKWDNAGEKRKYTETKERISQHITANSAEGST